MRVIASAAKQSRGGVHPTPGLLRRFAPRNDEDSFRPRDSGGGGPSCAARWWRGLRPRRFVVDERISLSPAPPPPRFARSPSPVSLRDAGADERGQLAFRPCPADINGREVGGGRATRQPGQVRKEAALTSAVRVARQPPTSAHVARMSEATSGNRARGRCAAPGYRFAHPGYIRIQVSSHRHHHSRLGRFTASHLRMRSSKITK